MECAPTIKPNNGVCSDDKTLEQIKKETGVKDDDPQLIIEKAKEKTNCNSESCVVSKVDKNLVDKLFRPKGPYDSIDWLSNVNIDGALSQYEPFGFYHIPFQMRDFAQSDNELSRCDWNVVKNKGYKGAGCALNTDLSSGRGKHWVSFYVDFSNKTVEYFDSGGSSPHQEFVDLVVNVSHVLGFRDVFLTQVQHQKKDTECGVYTLYYLTSRIMDIPYSKFAKGRITDEEMQERRKTFFRHS